jgi:tripartite-type tricarboxylate transporter receptor subunit TctC
MGGTGSKQEDQIITVALEKVAGSKFTYVPVQGRRRRGHPARRASTSTRR